MLETSSRSIARLDSLRNIIERDTKVGQARKDGERLGRGIGGFSLPRSVASNSLLVVPEHAGRARAIVARIESALRGLIAAQANIREPSSGGSADTYNRETDSPTWTLGSVTYCLERRPVLRGEVEWRNVGPIAPDIPDRLVQYLASVPGTRDQIAREAHGHWGYHYHYLDSDKRRSDTLLTFGRGVGGSTGSPSPILFWERHAEGQKFRARADSWRKRKRRNVYEVCYPDTLRFGLASFKRPASDALTVWPLD